MTGVIVTGFAFLTGFLGIFGMNLIISDVFLKDRAKMRDRLNEEQLRRHRSRVKQALEGRDLDELAEEAFRETRDNKTITERIHELIEQSGLEISTPRLLGLCAIVGLAVALPLGFLLGVVVGVVFGAVASALPIMYVHVKRQQRMQKLLSQLPDALELMSRILRAGQTISQAMLAVSAEFNAPIAAEFGHCYEQQNLGLSMEVALRDLANRTGLLEIRIFVLALLVHRKAGGNLTELLDNLATLIRERYRMRGKIRALTAEGRFQAAALIILPVVAFFALLLVNRSYAVKLFEYPWLLAGCAISMGIGAVWIRRIVNFDF